MRRLFKIEFEELKKVAKLKDLENLYKILYEENELPGKTDGYMYILRPVDENGIYIRDVCKIGETSKNVEEYVKRTILPKSPFELKIVAVIRGRLWEMFFHMRYKENRKHNEWFKFDPEMLKLIGFLKGKNY